MQKIFVITKGTYSDYHICAIFDEEELAKKYISSFNNEGCWDLMEIEEWELNPNMEDIIQNKKAYTLSIDKEGNTNNIRHEDSNYGFSGEGLSFTRDAKWMNVHCFANDVAHAIKIANEKRVQILAANRWNNL